MRLKTSATTPISHGRVRFSLLCVSAAVFGVSGVSGVAGVAGVAGVGDAAAVTAARFAVSSIQFTAQPPLLNLAPSLSHIRQAPYILSQRYD
jgi:hypothetical protein